MAHHSPLTAQGLGTQQINRVRLTGAQPAPGAGAVMLQVLPSHFDPWPAKHCLSQCSRVPLYAFIQVKCYWVDAADGQQNGKITGGMVKLGGWWLVPSSNCMRHCSICAGVCPL